MDKDQLVKSLRELHAELSQKKKIDPEALRLLESLTADADRLLGESGEADKAEGGAVSSGLRDLILKFEAEHPQMAQTLGGVADSLAALGI
jgi:hypothetical protein